MEKEKIPLHYAIGRYAYIFERSEKMKKFLLGGLFAIMFNYCLGSTYLIYKGVGKNVRINRTDASTAD